MIGLPASKKGIYYFAGLTGAGLTICVVILLYRTVILELQAQLLLPVTLLVSGIPAGLWVREYRRRKTARLITENPILHIRTAVISDLSSETAQPEDAENTEVIVSYFGILLDEKIIKFNQDGIQLRAVEIGGDFISFTYGTEKRTQNIRLLRPTIDPVAMAEISEKFCYETGIVPVIIQ
mgnify:CR=1 FL=1